MSAPALRRTQLLAPRLRYPRIVLPGARPEDLLRELVASWPLGEYSDGLAAVTRLDVWRANHLTDVNTVPSGAGQLGANAASFTAGSSEYLSRANGGDMVFHQGSWTLAGWVNFSSLAATRAIASKSTGGTPNSFYLRYLQPSDVIILLVNLNTTVSGLSAPSTGVWYYVRSWFDAARAEIGIQVSGNAAAVTTGVTAIQGPTTTGLYLGALDDSGPTAYLSGSLQHWAFWRRVLSPDEHAYLWNGGSPRPVVV